MSRTVSLIVGGIAAVGTTVAALFASKKTTDGAKNAVAGLDKQGTPALPMGSGVSVPVHLTGYWPFVEGLSAKERLMEGGHNDRKGKRLYTLEDFQAGNAPYVSVSADHTIFPYGQRVSIPNWPGVVFRIVDTGGHFFGVNKVFRIAGREPFDICVASRDTKVLPKAVDAIIYPGDHFEKASKDVAYGKLGKPQTAVGSGFDMLGAESV